MGTNIPVRAQSMRASGGVFVPFTVLVSLVTIPLMYVVVRLIGRSTCCIQAGSQPKSLEVTSTPHLVLLKKRVHC